LSVECVGAGLGNLLKLLTITWVQNPPLPSVEFWVCRGGFREFAQTVDDNLGSKPALTECWVLGV